MGVLAAQGRSSHLRSLAFATGYGKTFLSEVGQNGKI
jgi:hypothetical protein